MAEVISYEGTAGGKSPCVRLCFMTGWRQAFLELSAMTKATKGSNGNLGRDPSVLLSSVAILSFLSPKYTLHHSAQLSPHAALMFEVL